MTGYERPDAGQVYLRWAADHRRVRDTGVRPRPGPDVPADQDLPRLTVLENMLVARRPGLPLRPGRRPGAASCWSSRDRRRYARRPGRRRSPTASASCSSSPTCWSPSRPWCCSTSRRRGEPDADPATSRDRIRDLNAQGTTFLIVEHNMEFVMGLCHQVTVLDHGTRGGGRAAGASSADPRVLDAYLGAVLDTDLDDAVSPVTADAALAVEGLYAGYGGGDMLHDVYLHRPAGRHHLRGGAQRGGQVDPAQRSISGLLRPRRGRSRCTGSRSPGAVPAADPGHGRGPGAAAPQPVPGHDRAREPRPRRLTRSATAGSWPASRGRVHEMFPEVAGGRRRRRAACPAASSAWWSSPAPDARPVPDHAGRAVDGPGAEGAPLGVRRGQR